MDTSLIFAWIIAVLAGLACIGALAVVLVAEWYAIRRTLAAHRRQDRPPTTYWRDRTAVTSPSAGHGRPPPACWWWAGCWQPCSVLGMDGRLPLFLAWAAPGTLLVLVAGALVHQQRAPSMLDQPPLPERYRVADDIHRPVADVVAVAETEAEGRR